MFTTSDTIYIVLKVLSCVIRQQKVIKGLRTGKDIKLNEMTIYIWKPKKLTVKTTEQQQNLN